MTKVITRGSLTRIGTSAVSSNFDFQFNPNKIQEKLSVDWKFSNAPGQYLPTAVFSRYGHNTVSFQLFLYEYIGNPGGDYSNTHSVLKQMALLKLFQSPQGRDGKGAGKQFTSPGSVILTLGSTSWKGVVTSLSFDATRFNANFDPVTATADIEFVVASQGALEDDSHMNNIIRAAGAS